MKWYEKSGIIILFLIIFFPIGLFLMWRYANWKKFLKGMVTFILAIFVIAFFMLAKDGGDNQNYDFGESTTKITQTTNENSEKTTKQDTNYIPTEREKEALEHALNYLEFIDFGYNGLIGQLEHEGYTTQEATYAADNCEVNWDEQVLLVAKSYLEYTAYSYKGMIEALEHEGFTTEQATRGADECGADWKEQAVLRAKAYLEYTEIRQEEMEGQLKFDGFTDEQIKYAMKKVY